MKIRNGFVSNSSTSSFICTTKESNTTIEAKLEQLLEFYNEWEGKDYKFKDVFKILKITKEKIRDLKENWNYNIPKHATFIIEGADDNSIPYELFDFIVSKFNASRLHLG